MYTYRDFEKPGTIHRTRAEFHRWAKGGPMNVAYAVFRQPRTGNEILVPAYLLTKETKEQLSRATGGPVLEL